MAGTDPSVLLRSVVLDCPDPPALARFYADLLGGEADTTDPDWCDVHLDGLLVKLSFQRAGDYRPPDWPDGAPQQLHLDLTVTDLEDASRRAVELGARVVGGPVREPDGAFLVHLDPAGHPFCLCTDDEPE